MIDFPASPINGQVFTSGAQSWTYDGTKWVASGNAVMPPLSTGDNRIINGDMRIDARNNGASGTATGYTVDRWGFVGSPTGKGQWQRAAASTVILIPQGFGYALSFTSLSAYASAASDSFQFYQIIEADMISDLAWGTANAQPVTLSFLFNSSLTGTFGGAVKNDVSTRCYPFSFSYSTANAWSKIVVTIPGDTTGAWVLSGNAKGLTINFDLGSGSTYRGSAGVWGSTNYNGVTGAVSVVATNAATFYVTGVKLEAGSVATPFNRQSLAKSMSDCQRYYQKVGGAINQDITVQGYNTAGGAIDATIGINAMRAVPTAAIIGSFGQSNVTSVTLFPGLQTVVAQIIVTATGNAAWYTNGTSTYITLSAEL